MTDSSRFRRSGNRAPLWAFPLPDAYPADLEGQILLRGGAKIRLKKCVDFFSVRLLQPIEDLSQWAKQFGCTVNRTATSDRAAASIRQIVLQVEPSQLEGAMARLRRSPEVGFATHAYSIFDPQSNPFEPEQTIFYLTHQIALQFQPQTTATQMEAIARAAGLEVLTLIPGVPKAFVYQLNKSAIVNPIKLANRLIYHPDILLAEPNLAVPLPDGNRASAELPEKLNLTGGSSPRADRSIVVAVIDRSIDLSHPAFAGMGKIVAPLAATASESLSVDPEKPEPSSGTLCAQIAVGEGTSAAEQSCSSGIAPGCSLMPITIDGLLDDGAIEQIFDWGIRQGAAVFCWNLAEFLPQGLPASLRQRSALHRAAVAGRGGRGCVVLVRSDSGWDEGSEVFCVAMHQFAAIDMGIMTGIAARILTVNPDLTGEQVKQILRKVAVNGSAFDRRSLPNAIGTAVRLALDARADLSASLEKHRAATLETLEFGDSRPQEIPDGTEPGLICSIAVPQPGRVQDIEVTLAIDHAFLGDLKIWLVPPDGEAILLQDRTLGSLTSLNVCYGFQTTPHLKRLLGRSAQGLWQIQICDRAVGHGGVLQQWQLRLGLEQPHQMS